MTLKEKMESLVEFILHSPAAFVAEALVRSRLPDYSSAEAADYAYVMGEE